MIETGQNEWLDPKKEQKLKFFHTILIPKRLDHIILILKNLSFVFFELLVKQKKTKNWARILISVLFYGLRILPRQLQLTQCNLYFFVLTGYARHAASRAIHTIFLKGLKERKPDDDRQHYEYKYHVSQ